jgi:glucose-1-phosphate thymidylyltransferase
VIITKLLNIVFLLFGGTSSKNFKTLSELSNLLKSYLSDDVLSLEMLPRGTAWFDSGTFEDLHEAGTYVKLMQERTGERVGDPFEISTFRGWVN